jgi:hypothetical protein
MAEKPQPDTAVGRHLRLGWAMVLLFAAAGMTLEGLHAFKVGSYLDVDSSTRRWMWTLSHAHGTLLGLINVGFALTLERVTLVGRGLGLTSACLRAATLLMPLGFFLGGLWTHGGDPGVGVLLVPIGGAALLVALAATVQASFTR